MRRFACGGAAPPAALLLLLTRLASVHTCMQDNPVCREARGCGAQGHAGGHNQDG